MVFIPFITVLVSLAACQNHVMLVARAEALQESRARLVAAADRKRREIERNLHDGAQQAWWRRPSRRGWRSACRPDRVGPPLGRFSDDLREAGTGLRDLAHGIYPPHLALPRRLLDGLPTATRTEVVRHLRRP